VVRYEDIFVVQRVVPHYRVPLFAELHRRYGLRVITSKSAPEGSFLKLADPTEHDFAIPADFTYPKPDDPFAARVPVDWIMNTLKPRGLIAEFALRMSSSYSLPLMRRTGRLKRLAFWTHGLQIDQQPLWIRNIAIRNLRLPLLASADVLATYTESGRRWAAASLPATPCIALGNALDTAAIERAAKAATPIRHGQPQLLFIGRFTADKAIPEMLDTFALVQRACPGAALTLIGDGPDRAKLERQARERFGEAVLITGALHEERELAPHFLGADLLLMPGAAGLSVNHALAYRLPIVAFNEGAVGGPHHHPEIEYVRAGVSGALVSPATAEAMAAKVVELVASDEPARLRERLDVDNPAPTISMVVDRFGELCAKLS